MGVNGTGGQRVMFRSTFSMGRGVPSLSIRAHEAAPGKAARPKPWRCLAAFSRGRRWGEDAFLVRFPWLLELWLGGGRFFSALPAGLRPIALRARAGAALVFFWADAHEGKGRTFLKKGAPRTFMLAALGALFRFYMTFSGLWPRWSNVFRKGLPAAWPWQMAKAKASAVSSGWGTFCNPSSRRVISWTWGFTALP